MARKPERKSGTTSRNISKTGTIMLTKFGFTLFLLSLANNVICGITPAKRVSQSFNERSTFTGGNALALVTCASTLTSCNWSNGASNVGWCCPFSTVCDGIGGGGYCCPTCKLALHTWYDRNFTDRQKADDCGPSVDAVPRCADPSWSMWVGGGTGTHDIDGSTVIPKYFCCLGNELGLMNDTCVANTVVLSSGEQATLVSSSFHSWVDLTASYSSFPIARRTSC